jgi:hypothetical protein
MPNPNPIPDPVKQFDAAIKNRQGITGRNDPLTGSTKGLESSRSDPAYTRSTLQKSRLDPKLTPRYEPLKIMCLTGAYARQFLDLGCNSMTLSESQSASWNETEGNSVRQSLVFKNVSTRSFELELDYWDNNEDVRQLVENNAHLQEITDFSHSPPDLQIITGTAPIDPVVCDSFTPTYDCPLPGNRGWRHGVVRLGLKLRSERNSKHELAPALSPTPWGDYKRKTSASERSKQAVLAQVEGLLEPCLGEKGVQQVTSLIKSGDINNPDKLLQLDPNTFIQLAATGFPSAIAKDPRIQEKLKSDLALTMVTKENGMNPVYVRTMAQALVSGDSSQVPAVYLEPVTVVGESKDGQKTKKSTNLYEMMQADYGTISQAFLEQKLSPNDDVFNRDKNPTASQRVTNLASCGMGMRSAGAPLFSDVSGNDAVVIKGLNEALANPKISNDQIRQMFGLPASTPETVIRKLRSSAPYDTKEEFIKEASANSKGFTSYNMWSSFTSNENNTLSKINGLLQSGNLTDDQIKEYFGVISPQDIKKIKESKNFSTKENFLALFGTPGTGNLEGQGNRFWMNFKLNEAKIDSKKDEPK